MKVVIQDQCEVKSRQASSENDDNSDEAIDKRRPTGKFIFGNES